MNSDWSGNLEKRVSRDVERSRKKEASNVSIGRYRTSAISLGSPPVANRCTVNQRCAHGFLEGQVNPRKKMARVVAVKEYLEKALKDESKPWAKLFALAEEKTGVDRLYIFVGSLILLAIYLVFGLGQQLVCNIVGFVYPAYQSMKALESPKKEDDTKWLTYWVVFAVFTIVEFFSEYIVCWFPVYWLFKCIFYVWLMAPTAEYNGSLILYRRIIRPKFIQYQPGVDKFLSNARDTAVKTAADALLTNKQD